MKIEVLFPEICNLYADLQNIEYLRRSAKGSIEVIDTGLRDRPAFADSDDIALIYMGSTTESGQLRVIEALRPYKQRLAGLIRSGQAFLMTGNAMEVFGEYIQDEDKSRIECLGLFPTFAVRDMMNRYNSLWIGQFKDIDVVGFKSQFTQTYFDDNGNTEFGRPAALFTAERGDGINPGTREEGYRCGNFLATYLLGPLFITNPKLTRKALEWIGLPSCEPLFEKESMESYEKRVREFRQPERGFTY
ncbi:MAG: hypothetical protein LKG26_02435 [Saccharofermentans sp.]|jgi:CobQ-like glutamine amidotransferase family enzyme|nr:hypothetical protein [Mageeibacillus sp.]MCI1264253.1 hypothetical protein [Saccharofermentans sp.]MCI1274929.1 hypothetical protein [Saccharofermentans sp.]MCI2044417.1 hypothetical protein [Mageeibacillus sp.]